MENSQLTFTNGEFNTREFISSFGGTGNLFSFLKNWSRPNYPKHRFSDHSWGLIPWQLEQKQNHNDIFNKYMFDLINKFQFSNTVVQHNEGNINSWISGMGYKSYGLYLNEELKQFSTNKFLIHTLDSSKQVDVSIEKYLSKHEFTTGYESFYPRKLYCFDTILNPMTETDISKLIRDELGFIQENHMIQQRIDLTNELIDVLPELKEDSKVLNPLETINRTIDSNIHFENKYNSSETKNKKQIKSGFENKTSFSTDTSDRNELINLKKYFEKETFLLEQFNLVKDNKIVGQSELNLSPFFNEITLPIRRINLLIGESRKIEYELLGFIVRYLHNKGVKSIVMMVDIDSSERKILEDLRDYTAFEQTLFTVYRKEGPDYEEVSSWIDKSEHVDYIEIALNSLYGKNVQEFGRI